MPLCKEEIWKDVVGYEGLYVVSNLGVIKSTAKTVKFRGSVRGYPERYMKYTMHKKGYLTVGLCKNGKPTLYKVHRIVALSFIPNPNNNPMVNHKDGDKTNNRVANLEWATSRENTIHGWNNGLCKPFVGQNHGMAKLTNGQVLEIYKSEEKSTVLAKKYGLHWKTVSKIRKNKIWTHVTSSIKHLYDSERRF